jgi:hypothetical protein
MNPSGYAENPHWETDLKNIRDEYSRHKKELEDLEYNYLHGQPTILEAQIKQQVEARMEELHPKTPPAKKSGGMFGWVSTNGNWKSTTDMRVLLDELRQLNAA